MAKVNEMAIGVINQAVDRKIIGNKVIINNAKEMFHFCKNHLQTENVLTRYKFFLYERK